MNMDNKEWAAIQTKVIERGLVKVTKRNGKQFLQPTPSGINAALTIRSIIRNRRLDLEKNRRKLG